MEKYYDIPVIDIKKETQKSVVVSLKVSDNYKSFDYQPGQYISLKFTFNGKVVIRDYSICRYEKKILQIGVKEIRNGFISAYINKSLKKGDVLNITRPKGVFVLNKSSTKDIVAIAAGSGITPIISILKSSLSKSCNSFDLVYSNKSAEKTMFLSELLTLKDNYRSRFKLKLVYTEIKNSNDDYFGRINKINISEIIDLENINAKDFYICGPEKMLIDIKSGLIDNNVHANNIRYELFKSDSSVLGINNLSGEVGILFQVDDYITEIKSNKKKSILESALENEIDAPYSCNGGVCGSCIAKISDGIAKMSKNSVLSDKEISDGLVLTCQAFPESSYLKVDYDNI